jgi:hypothetical protein
MSLRCHPSRGLAPLAGAGLALLLALTALPADAQWRWRDASGRITASDLPPPHEIPDKDILQRPAGARAPIARPAAAAAAASAAAPAAAPSAASAVDKELEAKKRATEQQQKDKAKAEEQRQAAARADNCARARKHLATMESGQRIARMNNQGEREILDDKARAEEIRRAREVIASDCR